VINYSDDWLRARADKGSMTEIKREVIDLREDKGAYGQNFSSNFDKENQSIKRMKTNKRKMHAERKEL
jgi:hypothetical protein